MARSQKYYFLKSDFRWCDIKMYFHKSDCFEGVTAKCTFQKVIFSIVRHQKVYFLKNIFSSWNVCCLFWWKRETENVNTGNMKQETEDRKHMDSSAKFHFSASGAPRVCSMFSCFPCKPARSREQASDNRKTQGGHVKSKNRGAK